MKMLCLLIMFFSARQLIAQPATVNLHQKAITLKRFLDQNHYLPVQWNDSTSAILYHKWIGKLDDEKIFFTQAEIAVLETYRTRLDNELLGNGWDFFNASTALYRVCLKRADSILKVLLANPFDFSKPDQINWPFTGYAKNRNELVQRWQQFLKWRVLENIADKLSDAGKPVSETIPADFAQLEKPAREKAMKQEGAFIDALIKTPGSFKAGLENDYLNTIAWCYDPHTGYMDFRAKKEFETMMSASEYSAGFELEENDRGNLVISFLQPGGSAWRSGQLHTGDELVKVKSEGIEKDVAEMDGEELERMLGGTGMGDLYVTVKTTAGEIKTVLPG
jgi:carboxyl-terminal processing protease